MSAFRDGGAAIERAATLAAENEVLKAEVAELRQQIDSVTSERDRSKAAIELRKVIRERDGLRAQLEEMRIANIAAVNRMREDAKAHHAGLERQLSERSAALGSTERRGRADPKGLEEALQKSEALAGDLREERDSLRKLVDRLVRDKRDDNSDAFTKRLVDDRDELARELAEVRAELAQTRSRARQEGLVSRLFRRLRR